MRCIVVNEESMQPLKDALKGLEHLKKLVDTYAPGAR
jgi:hypothetical protein